MTRAVSAFRYRSFLDPATARLKSLVNPAVEGDIKIAEKQLKDIDKQIKVALKDEDYNTLPDYNKEKLISNFMDVLEGSKYEDLQIPKYLYDSYAKAKKSIDVLSQRVQESSIARNLPEELSESELRRGMLSREGFKNLVAKNIEEGGYLSRLYQIFNDDTFKLADDVRTSLVEQIVKGKGVDISHVKKFLQGEEGSFPINDAFVTEWRAGNVKLTDLQADRYIDNVTKYYKGLKNAKPRSSSGVSVPVVRMNPGVVNKAQVDNEVIKAIMGEIKTPKEAYIHTISELSNFIAADTFYTGFKKSADAAILSNLTRNADAIARGEQGNESPLFVNTNAELQARLDEINAERLAADPNTVPLKSFDEVPDGQKQVDEILESMRTRGGKLDYVVLGRDPEAGGGQGGTASRSVYGDMFGYAIPRPMFNSMTNVVNTQNSPMTDLFRTLYGPLLQLKGASQYAKTILSPITQVRNVTSAAMFALANGNVGKGASVMQSVDLVFRDLIDKDLKIKGTDFALTDEVLDFLVDLQKRGVLLN